MWLAKQKKLMSMEIYIFWPTSIKTFLISVVKSLVTYLVHPTSCFIITSTTNDVTSRVDCIKLIFNYFFINLNKIFLNSSQFM